jgi:hypothetical protein
MLLKLTDKPIREENPWISKFPALNACTDRQLTYIALAFDYDSPFRKLPREDWKEKSALKAGYKYEKDGKRPDKNMRELLQGKVDTVVAGILEYSTLQYDADKEMAEAMDSQIAQFVAFLKKDNKTDKERDEALAYAKALPELKKKKDELRRSIENVGETLEEELDELGHISTLDRVHLEKQSLDDNE